MSAIATNPSKGTRLVQAIIASIEEVSMEWRALSRRQQASAVDAERRADQLLALRDRLQERLGVRVPR